MLKTETASLDYSYVVDGSKVNALDAVFMEQMCSATIITHRAKVVVEYLAEFPTGERKWIGANK